MIRLSARYVGEHVDLGYALTIHKAQGATVDHALVLADDGLYAEAGYTALTRGRHTNTLYAATLQPEHAECHGRRAGKDNPLEDVVDDLRRSHAQQLALARLAAGQERGASITD